MKGFPQSAALSIEREATFTFDSWSESLTLHARMPEWTSKLVLANAGASAIALIIGC